MRASAGLITCLTVVAVVKQARDTLLKSEKYA
jgi:hypothetical protein